MLNRRQTYFLSVGGQYTTYKRRILPGSSGVPTVAPLSPWSPHYPIVCDAQDLFLVLSRDHQQTFLHMLGDRDPRFLISLMQNTKYLSFMLKQRYRCGLVCVRNHLERYECMPTNLIYAEPSLGKKVM